MRRVMIIAGEASGDLHAANLVRSVHARDSAVRFFGIGGQQMREAGVEVLIDSAQIAVVGLIEVLSHFRTIAGALRRMRQILRTDPPDLLILTDYPDFNLRLAKTAKQCGVKVLYYISPQVWAWRQGRVKTIRERVDLMAVVFPFEEAFYRKHQVPVRFVGHPLVDTVQPGGDRSRLLIQFGLDPQRPTVGLFPGSRFGEIERLLPLLLETAARLRRTKPELQFLLPLASTLQESDLAPYLQDNPLGIKLVAGRGYDVMRACDAIAAASGTATLEIALVGTPMVVVYKVSALTYHIVKRLVNLEHIALCNIVADEGVVPELIQAAATPEAVAAELQHILDDAEYRENIRRRLGTVRERLGGGGGSEAIAAAVLEMLEEPGVSARQALSG